MEWFKSVWVRETLSSLALIRAIFSFWLARIICGVERCGGIKEITGSHEPVWFAFVGSELYLIPITIDIFKGSVVSFTVDNSIGFLVGETRVCGFPLGSVCDLWWKVGSGSWCELSFLVLGEKVNLD